jgi:hypothetical protein
MAELQHLRVFAAPLHCKSQTAWAVVRSVLGVILPLWIVLGIQLSASSAWAAAPVRGSRPTLATSSGPSAADDLAPMCDVHAASVAAHAEVPEVDEGKLEPLSCDALLKLVGWGKELRELDGSPSVARHAAPPSEPAQSSPSSGRPEGVIEQQWLLSMACQTGLVPDARLEGVSASSGHWRSVYRPPVARG